MITRYKRKYSESSNPESPKIYVADLAAYNAGHLKGQWLDLSDYSSGEEVMQAIQQIVGQNEYAIHDYENFPSQLYHESMNSEDFDKIYEFMRMEQEVGLPYEVIAQYGAEHDVANIQEAYMGTYKDEEDFAMSISDELDPSFVAYAYMVSETDRRLIAQEEADSWLEGEGLSEADLETNEEAASTYNQIHDKWFEGLEHPMDFLVDEEGMYSQEDFMKYVADGKIPYVQVDYDHLAHELNVSGDFDYYDHDGELYVFRANV